MLTDAEMMALKAQHGNKLLKVTIPATEFDEETIVVLKRPPRAEYKRFRSMLHDDQKADALETLGKSCVVYPDAVAFQAMLDERPALAEVVGGRAAEFAGLEGKAEAKKL